MNLVVVETKLNDAVRAMPSTFKLISGRFGNETKGCIIEAFCRHAGDRRIGESALEVASRHFGVERSCLWAFVAGFDGHHATSIMTPTNKEWYDLGCRLASYWKVHEKQSSDSST